MIRNAEPEGLTTVEATREAAERAGLRYVTDEAPGIHAAWEGTSLLEAVKSERTGEG